MSFDLITPFRVAVDQQPMPIRNEGFKPLALPSEEEDVVIYPRTFASDHLPADPSFSSTSTPNPDDDIENVAPFRFTFLGPADGSSKASDGYQQHNYTPSSSVLNILVPEPKAREARAPFRVLHEKPTKREASSLYTVSQNMPLFPLSSLSKSIFNSPRRRAVFSAEEKSLVHSLIRC
ncbi:uncharacterized protein BT62DRAFT_923624 [Guyanagaster necrorhizus]|uniref:Uncharacterized protein n=1 Tax=Guyanagaster necrorhizus TaxID=856835 RepID=A0A9P7VHZ6_9AGAR|nr:uncharacterized protein BT62DRAFT_923624 [Guyanagaster necrorhizus MCA 3950]KAG7441054.1 hypothetical protein BT62DRAFT_923624 [Guyanagaster necrorhizus MCA 3950]